MTDQGNTPYPQSPPPPGAKVQPEYQAKQGRTGGRVLVILAVSIMLAAIALFAILGGHAHQFSKGPAGASQQATKAANAQKFDAPDPSPRVVGH